MKSTVMRVLLTMLMVGSMAFQAFAAEYVYVTKKGKRYHHAESRFIKGKESVERITKKEAEERGLKPVSGYKPSPEDIEEEK